MAVLTKTDGALGLIPRPKLDIITDPVTKQQYFRDTSIPGSTYQPYTEGTKTGETTTMGGQSLPSVVPQPIQPKADPLTTFNKMVFDLLQGAKAGQLAKKSGFEELQSASAMAPAAQLGIEGLTPSDMISARQRQAGLYEPAISNINDRVQMFNDTLKFAKDLGETYFKNVQPSEETIEAVRNQLRAGFVPGEDALSKVGKFLTEDDWMAAAAAKKTTATSGGFTIGNTRYDAEGNVIVTGTTTEKTPEQKEIDSFYDEADNLGKMIDSGTMSWKDAWNRLHTRFPLASVELIDQTLGFKRRENE